MIESQQEAFAARLAKIVQSLAVDLNDDSNYDPTGVVRLLTIMANRPDRTSKALEILNELAPAHADTDQWTSWIRGGRSPRRKLLAEQFDDRGSNGGRKIRSVQTDFSDAKTRTQEAKQEVASARERLVEAEAELERAEAIEKRADALAKGAAVWSYLREINEVAAGAFAMGPAWTLMRVASGYLQTNAEWEKELSESQRAEVEEHRKTRKDRSEEMLQILDAMAGNPGFEISVFEALWAAVSVYSDVAAAAPEGGRKIKKSVGEHARVDDAYQVVSGIQI